MAYTALESMVAGSDQEPVDLPRLTVADVFGHYERMGAALERAIDAYKGLPKASQQQSVTSLKDITKACDSVIKTATRMLEANR